MATVAEFQARFPEFCTTDDDRVQMFLDDAALLMGATSRWLDVYDVAHQYYAAHMLAVAEHTESGDSGILAPASHQEVDDVVIKNAINNVDANFNDLLATAYGKRYMQYRRLCFIGPRGV